MTSSTRLQTRAIQDIVPYDHDLTQGDLQEILDCSLLPFLCWKSERFAKWLYRALYRYADRPGTEEERLEWGREVSNLLMPESAKREHDYDPLGYAVSSGNTALIYHVFEPFGYIRTASDAYRQRLLLLAQKSGNIDMLKLITNALDKDKIEDAE